MTNESIACKGSCAYIFYSIPIFIGFYLEVSI